MNKWQTWAGFFLLLGQPVTLGQTLPPTIPAVPPGTLNPTQPSRPPLPETLPDQPAPAPLSPLPTPTPNTAPSPAATVHVKQIEVLGSTVFSPEELAQVTAPFVGQDATFEQLLEIRTAITDLYTRRGYATSGAFLPAQDVSEGHIQIQVVEGELERIELKGLTRLNPDYVRSRLTLAGQTPLNLRRLESALQLLQSNPLLNQVQAQLTAGTTPGRSILIVNLQEANPLTSNLILDNHNSPSTGAEGGTLQLSHGNLTGLGDRLSANIERTEGNQTLDFSYELPINPQDGTLTLRYSHNQSRIIERPFNTLDINSNATTYSLGLRQPLYRTPTQEFALGLALDLRQSQTYLLGNIPFSFSVGPENGFSKVTALRFSQDWIQRSPNQVLAARSQFSLGLGALGATVNDSGIDGRFLSWVGQFQWVQGLGENTLAIARLGAQLTGDSLLPMEQFSIGGVDSVRGYRQNQRVGDSGVVGSVEVRFPVFNDPQGWGLVQIVPFIDLGSVWNSRGAIANNTLASLGLGLRWQIDPGFLARLDYGIPLNRVDNSSNTLADQGWSFSLQFKPF